MQLQGVLPQGGGLAMEPPRPVGEQLEAPAQFFGELPVAVGRQSVSQLVQLGVVGGELQERPPAAVELVFKPLGFFLLQELFLQLVQLGLQMLEERRVLLDEELQEFQQQLPG